MNVHEAIRDSSPRVEYRAYCSAIGLPSRRPRRHLHVPGRAGCSGDRLRDRRLWRAAIDATAGRAGGGGVRQPRPRREHEGRARACICICARGRRRGGALRLQFHGPQLPEPLGRSRRGQVVGSRSRLHTLVVPGGRNDGTRTRNPSESYPRTCHTCRAFESRPQQHGAALPTAAARDWREWGESYCALACTAERCPYNRSAPVACPFVPPPATRTGA